MKGTPRTAMTIVVAALALMLAAGTGATASLLITGKQIKDGSVAGADIKNRSLKVKDLSTKAKAKLKGATGPGGQEGAVGDEFGDRATGEPHERRQPGDADGGGHVQRERAEPVARPADVEP